MDSRLARLDLHTALVSLADLVMPRECVVCGDALLPDEEDICMCCAADLPLTRFEAMSHNPMADRYNERIAGEAGDGGALTEASEALAEAGERDERRGVEAECRRTGARERAGCHGAKEGSGCPEPYQYATALFFYEQGTGYDNITRALKYHRNVSVGRHFASMLGKALAASPLFADVDLVVPVPLHWTRHLSRGYNQASIIAREVALQLANPSPQGPSMASDRNDSSIRNVRFEPNLLIRQRRTTSQARIESSESKASNVRGAFRINKRKAASLDGVRHILLIDDVFTSGSTLGDCHRALRELLPSDVRISAATLGFTGN